MEGAGNNEPLRTDLPLETTLLNSVLICELYFRQVVRSLDDANYGNDLLLLSLPDRRDVVLIELDRGVLVLSDDSDIEAVQVQVGSYVERHHQTVLLPFAHAAKLNLIVFQE